MFRVPLNYTLLLLVACLDYCTSREVHLGSIYLLVVAMASWHLCPRALVVFAIVTVALWVTVDWMNGVHYSRMWLVYWNVLNRLGVVSITAVMVSKAKITVSQQQRLIRELGQTLLKISRFNELAPVCRLCHKIHLGDDYQDKLTEILTEGGDADTIGDICPACLEARVERVARIPVDSYFHADRP